MRKLASALALSLTASNVGAAEPVDVALVLAADVSLSMSIEELDIQRAGYVAALRHPSVVNAIRSGRHGRVAVAFVEWAGESAQRVTMPWTIIANAADAEKAAAALSASVPARLRRTSISGAIGFGVDMLAENPFPADRRVIDISGDGPNNQGETVTSARDRAVGEGIVINGLPLMTRGGQWGFDIDRLGDYFRDCVIGGPGSFVYPVNDWDGFAEAVRRKLVLEIAGTTIGAIPVAASPPADCLIGEKLWRDRMMDWN